MKIRWRPILGLIALSFALSVLSVLLSHKYYGLNGVFIGRIIGGAVGYYVISGLIPSGVFAIRKIRDSPDGWPYTAHLICLFAVVALTLFGNLSNPI